MKTTRYRRKSRYDEVFKILNRTRLPLLDLELNREDFDKAKDYIVSGKWQNKLTNLTTSIEFKSNNRFDIISFNNGLFILQTETKEKII